MKKPNWLLLIIAIIGLATLTYIEPLRPIIAAFLIVLLLYSYKRI